MGRVIDVGHQTRESIFINGVLDSGACRLQKLGHLHNRLRSCLGKVPDLGVEISAVLCRHRSKHIGYYRLNRPLPCILGVQ